MSSLRPRQTRDETAVPRWVKLSAAIALVLLLAAAGMLLAGHNPARHLAEVGAQSPAPSADPAPQASGKP